MLFKTYFFTNWCCLFCFMVTLRPLTVIYDFIGTINNKARMHAISILINNALSQIQYLIERHHVIKEVMWTYFRAINVSQARSGLVNAIWTLKPMWPSVSSQSEQKAFTEHKEPLGSVLRCSAKDKIKRNSIYRRFSTLLCPEYDGGGLTDGTVWFCLRLQVMHVCSIPVFKTHLCFIL